MNTFNNSLKDDFFTLESENEGCSDKTIPILSTGTRNLIKCAYEVLNLVIKEQCTKKFFFSHLNGECSCESLDQDEQGQECTPEWSPEVLEKQVNKYQLAEGMIKYLHNIA